MKRLHLAAAALTCAVGLSTSVYGQTATGTTAVTASDIVIAGHGATGFVMFTPVAGPNSAVATGQPIAVMAGGTMYAPQTFTSTITNGVIPAGFTVPDLSLAVASVPNTTVQYKVTVSDTASNSSFTLQAVTGVSGTTFALDKYAPSQTAVVTATVVATGSTVPTSCKAPSFFYTTVTPPVGYGCVGSSYLPLSGSASSSAALTLKINGTAAGSQTLLNLKAGSGVSLADDGAGNITIGTNGLLSPLAPPAVTPTANINLLMYTGQLAAYASQAQLAATTGGQQDEAGGSTATLVIPNTQADYHVLRVFPFNPATGVTEIANNTGAAAVYTASAYFKPSGSYTGSAITVALTSGNLTTTFNSSTCAAVTVPTGVTATATAAGNGYCQVQVTFSIPTGALMNDVQAAVGPTPTTMNTAGDGTNGGFVSHPQLVAGSSAVAYQDVTGMHRYAVAAYSSSGTVLAVSPWADCYAETCSVTLPSISSVAGATTAKLFRSGGYTWGALAQNGSTSLSGGVTVNDASLVADGTVAPAAGLTRDTRPSRYQITEKIGFGPQSATNLLILEPGFSGTITGIHISSIGIDAGNMSLRFRNCGSAGDQTVSFDTYLMTRGRPTPTPLNPTFSIASDPSDLSGQNGGAPGSYSGNRAMEINVAASTGLPCTVALIESGYYSGLAFVDMHYKVGTYLPNPLHAVWHAYGNQALSVPALGTVSMLPTVTSAGGGEVESVQMYVNSGGSTYMEGNPIISTDGGVAITANGMEDFYLSGFYFNSGTTTAQGPTVGAWMQSSLQKATAAWDGMFYRFFGVDGKDTVPFSKTAGMTWVNGQSTAATPPTLNLYSLVTYWTAQ